jgi:hypothetical protein
MLRWSFKPARRGRASLLAFAVIPSVAAALFAAAQPRTVAKVQSYPTRWHVHTTNRPTFSLPAISCPNQCFCAFVRRNSPTRYATTTTFTTNTTARGHVRCT